MNYKITNTGTKKWLTYRTSLGAEKFRCRAQCSGNETDRIPQKVQSAKLEEGFHFSGIARKWKQETVLINDMVTGSSYNTHYGKASLAGIFSRASGKSVGIQNARTGKVFVSPLYLYPPP